jgi:multidrug transporter EmrE-like cation transporter
VFISSASQILLKKAAEKKYDNIIQEYLNPGVITAYIIFFCSSLMTIVAYKGVPLSMGPILESCGYIFVTIMGRYCLKENISRKKVIGMVCILMGIIISYL